jgi:hypothetical protein
LLSVLVIAVGLKPPVSPLTVRLFALPGTSCGDWDKILHGRTPRAPKVSVSDCVMTDKADLGQLREYAGPNEVIAITDPNLPTAGSSVELSSNSQRYFVVRVNPSLATFLTWRHEMEHLRIGSTALRVPALLAPITNSLLDIFIDSSVVFGEHGTTIAVTALLIPFLTHWALQRLRSRKTAVQRK